MLQEKPLTEPVHELDPPLRGIYVHVPFCATRCDFCAFYEEAPQRQAIDRYLEGIAIETERVQQATPLGHEEPVTVFFGGGTPGLLPASDLTRLGERIISQFGVRPVEWTIEMAPSAVKADKVAALQAIGVTRVSLGVQSFDPRLLDALGRRQSPKQIEHAWQLLQDADFQTNIDLMFALPGQRKQAWLDDLQQATAMQPDHLSTYCLTFEEDTALWAKLSRGGLRRDTELETDLYLTTWHTLHQAGYPQYEVSNFARPGCVCRHNASTWQMGEWVGLGPSAASQWQGYRYRNVANLTTWLDTLEAPFAERHEAIVPLDPQLLATDCLIFGLRCPSGINLVALRERFTEVDFSVYETLWQELENAGYLWRCSEQLRLSPSGLLIADAIGGRIMES